MPAFHRAELDPGLREDLRIAIAEHRAGRLKTVDTPTVRAKLEARIKANKSHENWPSRDAGAPRRLTWTAVALLELEELVAIMPAAALEAVEAMEGMAATGFTYGRATAEAGGWYFPTSKLGIFDSDAAGELAVVHVLDARRLRTLP